MSDRRFTPGCLLSGCLVYLVWHALLALAGGVLQLFAISFAALPALPGHSPQAWARYALAVLADSPPILMIAVGGATLLQVAAIWRGERWGVIGIALMTVSLLVFSVYGLTNPVHVVQTLIRVGYALLPYLGLLWLARRQWGEMR
jgi:hypothetical protein